MGRPTTLDRALKRSDVCNRLSCALQDCNGTDGRIAARRNARARVLAALRAVRSHLDKEFPAIVVRKKARHATPETIRRRAERAGWVAAGGHGVGLFAAAGVPVRRVPHSGWSEGYALYVPGWAVAIGSENQAQLRAAKKSKQLRDAAIAQAALLQGT